MLAAFSDSWYRVAELKVQLLPTVEAHKQCYRQRDWYVLQDRISQRYYRVQPGAWRFLATLDGQRTVEQHWLWFVERYPQESPGQEEVIQLLAQLHQANLLHFSGDADNEAIFERFQGQKKRERLGKWMAFLYMRFPIWNPNVWLERQLPLIDRLFSRTALMVWMVIVLSGAVAVFQNGSAVLDQSHGLLAIGNLGWLYLCISIMKLLHELGHAALCKKYGGDVNTLGIMLLIFTPLPYMDATSSWSFRDRWQRAAVASAGMMVELLLAALAALVWVNTGEGLVNRLAFNVMIVGSVSSLIFNGNPLLRFDAYYILSDVLDIPNLYQKASRQWLYLFNRHLLGTSNLGEPASDSAERSWLLGFGLMSLVYRFLVMLTIVLIVADQWLVLGVVMALLAVVIWLFMPCMKLYRYLFVSDQVSGNRRRAIMVCGTLLLALVLLIAVVPMRFGTEAPGVLVATQMSQVHTESGGILMQLLVDDGERVEREQPLVRLVNKELEHDIALTLAQLEVARWKQRQALNGMTADLDVYAMEIDHLQQRLQELREREQNLLLKADQSGVWAMSTQLRARTGSWIPKGEELGSIIDPTHMQFSAVVTQERAASLFSHPDIQASIRLNGRESESLLATQLEAIPYQRQQLISAALGWVGGGDIAVRQNDSGNGLRTLEPFFEIRSEVELPEGALYLHGQSGWLRIEHPPQPLLRQWWQGLMQLLQKRYLL